MEDKWEAQNKAFPVEPKEDIKRIPTLTRTELSIFLNLINTGQKWEWEQ